MDTYGIEYLRRKLVLKRQRVKLRYDFYDMKNITRDFGISTPPDLTMWMSCLGWCGTAVDSMADRLMFKEFKDDNFGLNEIYRMNNPDLFFDNAAISALISSCCFIYIYPDDTGYPRLEIIDGGNATGVIDSVTGFLKEGYAVLERDLETGAPKKEAYFLPEKTVYYEPGREPRIFTHPVRYPLLVPVINRPDVSRPFGHSRISRACMSLVGSAIRTIKRSEIAAEFYSYPQKWVSGLKDDAEKMDKWRATMSALITFTKDEDGDKPVLGQFIQQSMTPHLDQLKMLASLFAGETGLTTDDLGFSTANPSTSEAIKASHENLRRAAKKCQRTFGSGFMNAGMLAASLRDEFDYRRKAFYYTTPVWYPIFEADGAALSVYGDGLYKLQQAFPDYITKDKVFELTGI